MATESRPEIGVAVRWWRAQLLGQKYQDAGDATINLFARVASQRVSVEQADRFAAELADELERQCDAGWMERYGLRLMTDYHPEEELRDVAERADVDNRAFPIKTVMWIEPGEVRVRNGYGAAEVVLYKQ